MRRLHVGSYASGFSLWRMLLYVSAILMAYFVQVAVFSSTALAADATWSNGNLVYQSQTYTKFDQVYPGSGLRDISGNQVYRYIDTAAPTPTAHFIYFPSGVDVTQTASAQYISYNYKTGPPEIYVNPSTPVSVTVDTGTTTPGGTGTGTGSSTKSCSSDFLSGVGWIICPFSNTLAKLVDSIYGVLTSFFDVRPLTADPDNGIFLLWNIIRNIANVAFVIVFLIIVYSQVTSFGISKYGVQKSLPRLLIGAILVNISYWICAIGVDLSNISGNALNSILAGIRTSIGPADVTISWSETMGFLLSGGTIAFMGFAASTGGSMAAGFFIALGGLISVAFSLIVAVAILAARQAIIVVFVALSPLAFVAYLLPSTEKLFSRWSKTFISMLVMFPMFALLFGGAQLAGTAIIDSADGNIILVVIGLITQVVPLALTPVLMNLSKGILSTVANLTNNTKKGVVDRAKNWTQEMADTNRDRALGSKASWWMGARRTAQAWDRQKRTRDINRKRYQTRAEMRAMGSRGYQNAETMSATADKEKSELQSRNDIHTINNSAYRAAEASAKTAEKDKEAAQSGLDRDVLRNRGYRAADRSARDADAYKKEAETKNQAMYDDYIRTDAKRLKRELKIKATSGTAETAKAELEKMHAEIVAEGKDSAYLRTKFSGTDLTKVLASAADIRRTSEQIAFSGMAKRLADSLHKSNVTERLNSDEALRQEIGAIRGSDGAQLIHATAIADERKQYGEFVSARQELQKHFKVSSAETAKLAKGQGDVEKTDSRGHKIIFKTDDEYTREAAIERIFQIGSYNDVVDVVESTGEGGVNYNYRSTVQDSLIKNGKSKIAPFLNDKAFDEILNGLYGGKKSTRKHVVRRIAEGRLTADDLTSANANALRLMFESIDQTNPDWSTALSDMLADISTPSERAKAELDFHSNYADMVRTARTVVSDQELVRGTSRESIKTMKEFLGITEEDDTT